MEVFLEKQTMVHFSVISLCCPYVSVRQLQRPRVRTPAVRVSAATTQGQTRGHIPTGVYSVAGTVSI